MRNKAVYIGNVDCKDLIIASKYQTRHRKKSGYTLKHKEKAKRSSEYNTRRFRAALDWSLDRIKLQEVYEHSSCKGPLYFTVGRKQYSTQVINVTFKYATREWNRIGGTTYIKLGVHEDDIEMAGCSCVQNGELVAIILDQPVTGTPLSADMLAPYFEYRDEQYKLVKQPKVVTNVAEARRQLYQNGFYCDGVHYVRWKRSAGSARVGKCLFINEALYDEMHEWEMCGLRVNDGDSVDLAALECYISLTLSSMVDTLDLEPENILVIDDYESEFDDEVISVEEHDGKLTAERKTCRISNSIWDGQGLISPDAMGAYSDKGMVLLRNRFFKCCAFNCNIQKWFADNGITEVSQLAGYTRAKSLEDIKLITTPSSIKYVKFASLDQWFDNLDPTFGVVKTDKKTHFFDGQMTQTHYQLLNTLQMTRDEVQEFLQPTLNYMTQIRDDPAVLRYHIKYPINPEQEIISAALSKNDIIFKMLGITDRFAETKLYHDFRADLLKSMTKDLRLGHVLVNGNYSTLCGNPIEMLQAAVGRFDGVSQIGVGNIHSQRFAYGQRLLGSRSPHVSMGNVFLPTNAENEMIDIYMNPTPEIVYINSIGESVLDRLSGADFDSDVQMLTDNQVLIRAALRNLQNFPVAAYNIVAKKIGRVYTKDQQCDLDIKTSRNLIGEIVNTAAEINTWIWDALNNGAMLDEIQPMYMDACVLNVMSNIEIDKAKKEFNVDSRKELDAIQARYRKQRSGRKVEPNFFAAKDRGKGYYDPERKDYARHDTTMDYVQGVVLSYRAQRSKAKKEFLPFSDLVTSDRYNVHNVYPDKVKRVLNLIRETRAEIKQIYNTEYLEPQEKARLAAICRQDGIEYVGELVMTRNMMIYLLRRIESERNRDIRMSIFNTLFGYPNQAFFELIQRTASTVPALVPNPEGDVQLFDFRFSKETT